MAGPANGDKNGAMRVDTKLVRELAKLLDEGNLSEIEVKDGDRKIRVSRGGGFAPAPVIHHAPAAPPPSVDAAQSPTAGAAAEEELSGTVVKSPMVGTAYLSPEPGAKHFAAVGDRVKAGDTLLIVEAMKVMNPITAPAAGTIQRIMISDAQPVEFDQPLVVIG
jgi:acetyl-CoA carboxylase biotin carboxyl carrier protein